NRENPLPTLYFIASDSVHGYELYSYNGQNQPKLVAESIPGPDGLADSKSVADIRTVIASDNYVYFRNKQELLMTYNWHTGVLKAANMKSPISMSAQLLSGFSTHAATYHDKLYFSSMQYDPAADTATYFAQNLILNTGEYFNVLDDKLYFCG